VPNSKIGGSNDSNESIIITSALPYANGEVHIGHVASTYLPADIFSRFLRLSGKVVSYICASDDFGTPILIKSEALGLTPEAYVEHWRDKDLVDFKSIGIAFDYFSKTSSSSNVKFVQIVYKILKNNGHIYEKDIIQFYCNSDKKFLPDRYVIGTCPYCKAIDQYSDLCEKCGRVPNEILDPKCMLCGARPVFKKSTHYFFKLSNFSDMLQKWLEGNTNLQTDVKKYVLHWVSEGLQDWDITRDIQWGVPIPEDSNLNKVFYGWFDNHLCYISTYSDLIGNEKDAKAKWNNSTIYHFIGKDIVYHHYLFLPAIRMGIDEYKLPDFIPTRGHLMLQNKKISKSRNWYIGLSDFINYFDPDYLRFYIASICSLSQDDINFDWEVFSRKINNELISNIGNLINRVLTFVSRYYNNKIPIPSKYDLEDKNCVNKISLIGETVGEFIKVNELDKALKAILNFSTFLNQYFQNKQPWKKPEGSETCIFLLVNATRSLAIMLEPFIPFSSEKIWAQLGMNDSIHDQTWSSIPALSMMPGKILGKIEPIFSKVEKSKIKEAIEKFNNGNDKIA
jgi:methionyl-tRNA synthetase